MPSVMKGLATTFTVTIRWVHTCHPPGLHMIISWKLAVWHMIMSFITSVKLLYTEHS